MTEPRAVISGIGTSDIGRRLHQDPWLLTADAALAAIADAGLTVDDIDGVSTYPGPFGTSPGITGAGAQDVRALLGLRLRWHTGGIEVPGQLGSIINAVLAVGSGLAEHVLCFRTVWESSAQDQIGGRSATLARSLVSEQAQWGKPYGSSYPTSGALMMQRYLHDSGSTRDQLGQIAVVARANAAHNDAAVYREPMSLDDYLDARVISDPLCLFDCDVPIDGSIAVVVSRADSTAIDQDRAITIEAVGSAGNEHSSAEMMWSRTSVQPSDVNVAQLYDGFSILAVVWMEALGLCPSGEAGAFIEGGHRIARDGELPINTGGGQLSAGRLHGYIGFHEACLQLRGLGAGRQVEPRPEVVVVSSGTAYFSSCLLLTRS